MKHIRTVEDMRGLSGPWCVELKDLTPKMIQFVCVPLVDWGMHIKLNERSEAIPITWQQALQLHNSFYWIKSRL